MAKVTAHSVIGKLCSSGYNPDNEADRDVLSLSLEETLKAAGFEQDPPRPMLREKVFSREIPQTGIRVQVFSTIVDGSWTEVGTTVRGSGQDAIRVVAVYKTRKGSEKGICKSQRVNRTGTIGGIVDRTLERARNVWSQARSGTRCRRCGAPEFISKAGNKVCAEICWAGEK